MPNGQDAIKAAFKRLRKEGYTCKQRETDYNFNRFCNGVVYCYHVPRKNTFWSGDYEAKTPEKYLFYKNTSLLSLIRGIGIVGLAWKGDLEEIKGVLESEGFEVRLPDINLFNAYKTPIYIKYKPVVI